MRKGFDGLALIVQETLKRDPHSGHLFVFRGRRGSLIKCLWSDGQGLCLFSKRLERGRFLWPSMADGSDDLDGPAFLSLVRHRLAHAAGDMASDGGWIEEKFCLRTQKGAPQTFDFVIPSDSWTPIFPPFRTTLKR
jgi:transposase